MADAINAINAAGGIAVLAHPYLNGMTDPKLFEGFLQTLKSMGLGGIEAIYPDHPEAATAEYCRLARQYGLLITGGAAFATGGISVLAKAAWDRLSRSEDPCKTARDESSNALSAEFPGIEPLEQLEPVHAGQVDVEKDQVRRSRAR